jgi:hypothetical protein
MLIAVGSLSALAQKKTNYEDFSRLHLNALAEMSKRAYRAVSEVDTFSDKDQPAIFKSITTTISAPPDSEHVITRIEDASGVHRTENIRVGEKSFYRENDDGWKEKSDKDGNSVNRFRVLGRVDESQRKISVEHKDKADDLDAELYIITTQEDGITYIQKYWFNSDKLLVRQESESFRNNSKSLLRTTTTYEYDPNIKVEAPKL